MTTLNNKVALVTGGASGIGQGIAECFAEAGAAVCVFDINGAGAEAVALSLAAQPSLAIQGDVSSECDVRAAVERTVAEFGGLDILINNAGIELEGSVADLALEQWERQLAVNLRGAYLFSHYAVQPLRARRGVILNISSVHAFVSYPRRVAYDTTKAGLLGMTRAMALDHGPDGIRVNAVCPGYIHTPLVEKWLRSAPDREARMQQILQAHPVGRIGTSRDVAEACLFLASDAASFITGACLVVDGGMTLSGR